MTLEWRLARFTIVALTVVCLGLAYAVTSGWRPAGTGDPNLLEISSINLISGTRDATFSARGMVPGDEVTAAITVANSGRDPMAYAMSRGALSDSGAGMSSALVLTIRTVGSSCEDYDGTILYHGPLDEAAFGRAGDLRTLPAATAEILCFRALLPMDVGNALQGATTAVTLTFGASRQTASR